MIGGFKTDFENVTSAVDVYNIFFWDGGALNGGAAVVFLFLLTLFLFVLNIFLLFY